MPGSPSKRHLRLSRERQEIDWENRPPEAHENQNQKQNHGPFAGKAKGIVQKGPLGQKGSQF